MATAPFRSNKAHVLGGREELARLCRSNLSIVAITPKHDPEFAAVLERARRRAEDGGELRPSRTGGYESPLSSAARTIVLEWLRDGGYDEAVALVVADDPELATQ